MGLIPFLSPISIVQQRNLYITVMKLCGLLLGLVNATRLSRGAAEKPWDFNDQGQSWVDDFTDCSASNQRQSPIDIVDSAAKRKSFEKFTLEGYDEIIDWKSTNNGKGIKIMTNETADISFTGGGLDGKYNFAQF